MSPARQLRRLLLLLWPLLAACAQDPRPEPPVAGTAASESSEVPQVPGISGLLRGFNAGVTFSSSHDSGTGWATVFQPAIGYSFNDVFAVDVTVPIYMYRLAGSLAANPPPNALLVPRRAEPGDVLVGFHAQFIPHGLQYQATLSATLPSGDDLYGLSTGRTTFDFSNRFEHSFQYVTPNVELGLGDSSSLVNPLVLRDFTSLGPLAHFTAGFAFALPLGASFEADAYEQLPIGDQKIYQTIQRRGNQGPARTVVTGRSVAEDNGFTNSIDIPLDRHTTLSAYYNRSLRLRDDVFAVGVSYVLRGSRPSTPAPSP